MLDAFEKLLDAEAGDGLWAALEAEGWLDALKDGLTLAEAEPLLRALGRRAIDLPVAEEMARRAHEHLSPAGRGRVGAADRVRGLDADRPASPPYTPLAPSASRPLPAGEREVSPLLAVMAACEIAGGAERLLEMSLAYAGQRRQFGKPLAAFQAIQQQLAVLAEQVVLVRIAGQLGCAGGLAVTPARAGVAKHVASKAVPVMTGIAHAVHGAIGITADFPLARLTARMHALRIAHGSESWWARVLGEARLDAGDESLAFVRAI